MPELRIQISKSLSETLKAEVASGDRSIPKLISDALWNELGKDTSKGRGFADHLEKLRRATLSPEQKVKELLLEEVRPTLSVANAMTIVAFLDFIVREAPIELADTVFKAVEYVKPFRAAVTDKFIERGLTAEDAKQVLDSRE